MVHPSCVGQNAKAPIIERDPRGFELAKIYGTCDGADDCYREQPGQTTAAFTPEAALDRRSGALTMTAVVKGATTRAIPTDKMAMGASALALIADIQRMSWHVRLRGGTN
jgi:hypothetical protein